MKRHLSAFLATTLLVFFAWAIASTTTRSQGRPSPSELAIENVDGYLVVAGDALVRFAPNTPVGGVARVAQSVAAETVQPLGSGNWQRLHSSTRSAGMLIAALRTLGGVQAVEPNYIVSAIATPNDPMFPQLWGLNNTTNPGADI